jgi:tetratricopeptide (TPR) repeat protein
VGRFNEANFCYDQAIFLDTNPKSYYWNNKGTSMYCMKKVNEALELYNIAAKMIENGVEEHSAEIWFNKGNLLDDIGKYEEAVECYDKAILLNANVAEYWNNKATSLYNLNKFEESMNHYQMAIKINPCAEYWNNVGNW